MHGSRLFAQFDLWQVFHPQWGRLRRKPTQKNMEIWDHRKTENEKSSKKQNLDQCGDEKKLQAVYAPRDKIFYPFTSIPKASIKKHGRFYN